MQRKILFNISPAAVAIILILSSATALVYNYFNPQGLTIISLSEEEEPESSTGEVRFYQPIPVNSEDALTLFENRVQFIDVRTPTEYKKGNVPESINLPPEYIDDSNEVLSFIPKDSPLVIYGGSSSEEDIKIISEHLFSEGFNRIYIYSDGFENWIKNNYPVAP